MKKIVVLTLTFFISGCLAATRVDVPLNYDYSGSVEPKPRTITRGLIVIPVEDNRTVATPDIIKHLRGTTGGLVAEKPISKIVHEGLEQALIKSGHNLKSDGITLKVSIEDYSFENVSGPFSLEKVTSTLSISVLLKDSNGTKLAKKMVVGKGLLNKDEIEFSWWGAQSTGEVFKKTLDDAITQIVELVNIEMTR